MKSLTASLRWPLLCAALTVTGCFHDSDDKTNSNNTITTTVSGTAATGAAMSGTVTAVGANGAQANTILSTGGTYTLNVNGLTFPLLIRAHNGAGTVLYSWADAAGDIANITPLTTLALVFSELSDNLDQVFVDWATSNSQLTAAKLQAEQAKVNANLQTQFSANGVDKTRYDFLTTAFTADGSGIDAVLDGLKFSFDFPGSDLASVVTIKLAGTMTPVTININIDASGIALGSSTGGSSGTTGSNGVGCTGNVAALFTKAKGNYSAVASTFDDTPGGTPTSVAGFTHGASSTVTVNDDCTITVGTITLTYKDGSYATFPGTGADAGKTQYDVDLTGSGVRNPHFEVYTNDKRGLSFLDTANTSRGVRFDE